MAIIILGLEYIDVETSTCSGHNCDFEYGAATSKVPCIYIDYGNGEYYKYMMWVDESECGSGWCVAHYGSSSITAIAKKDIPRNFDLIPKKGANVLSKHQFDLMYRGKDVDHRAFSFSGNGGDVYYPSGYAYITSEHWD